MAKFSGIGCSSKSPAYFLGLSHGFNGVHGRMPAIATGALLANRNLLGLGVTGDGDTASIGIGQFMHLVRRNMPMIYIIEDNGVYGLTKGQFSATADLGSTLKTGVHQRSAALRLLRPGAADGAPPSWRAPSAATRSSLQAILKTAIAHHGLSVIDVISPCVTFNDHEGSTKSYSYMKEHEEVLQELDFVPSFEEISVEIPEGEVMRRPDARRLPPAHPQARPRFRPHQPPGGADHAGGGRRRRRSAHRRAIREHRKAHFHGHAEHGGRPRRHAAAIRNPPPKSALDEIMEELR